MGKKHENKSGIITAETKKLENNLYTNSSPSDRKFSRINKHNASGKALDFLVSKGLGKKNLKPESVTESKDGKFGVVISYEYEKNEIFLNRLLIMASEKGVEKISGPFLKFMKIEKGYYNTVSSQEVLIDYLSFYGNSFPSKTELKNVNCGYYVPLDSASVSSYAIPAYEFVFSDNKTLYLDARKNIEPEFKLLGNI